MTRSRPRIAYILKEAAVPNLRGADFMDEHVDEQRG